MQLGDLKSEPRTRRGAEWSAEVARALPGTSIQVNAAFEGGRFQPSRLGGLHVHRIEATPHRMEHRPTLQLRNLVSVLVVLRGELELQQDGRRCRLRPGQMMLGSSEQQLSARFDSSYQVAFVLVPAAELAHLPRPGFGQVMSAEHASDRLLFDYVAALPDAAAAMASAQFSAAREALVALIGLSTAVTEHASQGASRLDRALQYLAGHLADPELCAAQIAAAQRVSRRFLDQVFAAAGTTVERVIWEQRLQRAAARLTEGILSEIAVQRIALDCGFRSASHFGRRFRARFGMTPQQWRLTRSG
jgi:AraC-like DNA-binding protein